MRASEIDDRSCADACTYPDAAQVQALRQAQFVARALACVENCAYLSACVLAPPTKLRRRLLLRLVLHLVVLHPRLRLRPRYAGAFSHAYGIKARALADADACASVLAHANAFA